MEVTASDIQPIRTDKEIMAHVSTSDRKSSQVNIWSISFDRVISWKRVAGICDITILFNYQVKAAIVENNMWSHGCRGSFLGHLTQLKQGPLVESELTLFKLETINLKCIRM